MSEIVLRPWAAEDRDLLHRLLGDPTMTRWIGGPETPAAIDKRHERYLARSEPSAGQMLAVVLRETGEAVGSTGFWEHDEDGIKVWETGWHVLPDVQGRGIATAATRLTVEAAWWVIPRPVHAYPNVENTASNAIARKVGFRLLGEREFEYPKGHWMRCNDWVIDPPDVVTV